MLTEKEAVFYKLGRIFTCLVLCCCAFGVGRYVYVPIHNDIVFDNNHYEHQVICRNCRYYTWFYIDVGITVDNWKETIECHRCGVTLSLANGEKQ